MGKQVAFRMSPHVARGEVTEWPRPKTGRMHVLLVLGSPGSGKSTLVDSLSRACPLQNAHLDADHVAYTRPGGTDRGRMDLVERNLLYCTLGFRKWGAEYVFCAWVTEYQHRLDGFLKRLRIADAVPRAIALDAPTDVLTERMRSRPDPRFEESESSMAHLERLSSRIRRLYSCEHVDTDGLRKYDVLKRVRDVVTAPHYWDE